MSITTKLTELLGVQHPVMLAGMGGIAGKELVGAVGRAGGFATFGAAVSVSNDGPEELRAQLREIRALCGGAPYGVDLLVHGAEGGVMPQLIKVFAEEGARAFISGRGFPRRDVIDKFHAAGMVVGAIAGKVSHATRAAAEGVDFVIVQGAEGGGHTGAIALSVLLPLVVDAVGDRVPVVAAGGIFDGRGLAAALALGAQGVWVGTRFMMTPEAETHAGYKAHLLRASAGDTVVTRAFTGAPLRALANDYTRRHERESLLLRAAKELPPSVADAAKALPKPKPAGVARSLAEGAWELHGGFGKELDLAKLDYGKQAFVTGQCIGAIDALLPAAEIVTSMVRDAVHVLSGRAQHFKIGPGAAKL